MTPHSPAGGSPRPASAVPESFRSALLDRTIHRKRKAVLGIDRLLKSCGVLEDGSNAVLMYHSVGETGLYGNVSTERFRRDMRLLCRDYDPVSLAEAMRVRPRRTNRKKVAVTFDDGYANFYSNALPVLREFNVPATVFVCPEFIGTRPSELFYRFFHSPEECTAHNDPTAHAVPDELPSMLSESQLAALVADERVTIGNHTRSHPDLRTTGAEELDRQIIGAKTRLEDRFGITIRQFSYPYGRYTPESAALVRRSHDLAVLTRPGLVTATSGDHSVPRIQAHDPQLRVREQLTDLRWKRPSVPIA